MNSRSEEAARWFAASRRGVMLHDERQAYDAWRAIPANAAALAELQAVWDALAPVGAMEPAPAPVAAANDHRRQLAAVVGFMVLMVAVLPRIDNGWLNALDWWSR